MAMPSMLRAQTLTNSTNGTIRNAGTICIVSTASATVANAATIRNYIGTTPGLIQFASPNVTAFQPVFENNGDNGTFDNSNAGVDGVLEFLGVIDDTHDPYTGTNAIGASAASRIEGTVRFATSANGQFVHGNTFYTNLIVTGAGTKTIQTGVNIGGGGVAYQASGGDRTYVGTFTYESDNAQTIDPESNGTARINRYNNLQISSSGTRTIAGDVDVDGTFTQDAVNHTVTVNNGALFQMFGTFDQPAGAGSGTLQADGANSRAHLLAGATSSATIGGTVQVDNGGQFLFSGKVTSAVSGALDVNNGTLILGSTSGIVNLSGTLDLADAANAQLIQQASSDLRISGTFTNNHAARVNQTFATDANTRYIAEGAQTIVSSVEANPYGNLFITTATDGVQKTAGGNVFMSGALSVGGTDNGTGNLIVPTGNTLTMLSAEDAIYTGGTEVVGSMKRTMVVGTNTYRLNNINTIFTRAVDGTLTDMTLTVLPGVNPLNYDANRDVKRKVTVAWNGDGWVGTFRVGYKASETTAILTAPEYAENSLRFFEANGNDVQKVGTRQAYDRVQTDPVRYVELAGISTATAQLPPSANNLSAQLFSGNDLLLRAGPVVFASVNNGRWSNPGTWDEAREPTPTDSVLVRHTVHAGWRRNGLDEILQMDRFQKHHQMN
jgi:hypothetical protein